MFYEQAKCEFYTGLNNLSESSRVKKRFHADAVQDGVTNKARQIGHFAGDNRRQKQDKQKHILTLQFCCCVHFNTDCYQFERSLYTLVCNDGVFDKPLLVSTAGYELGLTSYLPAQINLTGFFIV